MEGLYSEAYIRGGGLYSEGNLCYHLRINYINEVSISLAKTIILHAKDTFILKVYLNPSIYLFILWLSMYLMFWLNLILVYYLILRGLIFGGLNMRKDIRINEWGAYIWGAYIRKFTVWHHTPMIPYIAFFHHAKIRNFYWTHSEKMAKLFLKLDTSNPRIKISSFLDILLYLLQT